MPTKKQTRRKLVQGVGVNDADYHVCPRDANGKQSRCPFYEAWFGMLKRCYSSKYHSRFPTYIGCSVVREWLTFSNFKAWMGSQDWDGKQLDKDILCPGNKVYGPKHCVFVASQVNSILSDCAATRGEHPIGVCFNKAVGKFQAGISERGKWRIIGYFTMPEDASAAYMYEKVAHIKEVAETQPPRIKAGLLKHAELLSNSSRTAIV